MKQTCENCAYFKETRYGSVEGQCRRHTPVIVQPVCQHTYAQFGQWPLTYNSQWCGEWQPKPEATDEPK